MGTGIKKAALAATVLATASTASVFISAFSAAAIDQIPCHGRTEFVNVRWYDVDDHKTVHLCLANASVGTVPDDDRITYISTGKNDVVRWVHGKSHFLPRHHDEKWPKSDGAEITKIEILS
ncbi:hypothetical protein ACIBL8_45905 [Streptomyces sp. NPDC050523]|uniref:hypothetical protein n=1 Tax=Streptomyces sp. NPDC050523 TaxID=3365622 RepID=UPI0037B70038